MQRFGIALNKCAQGWRKIVPGLSPEIGDNFCLERSINIDKILNLIKK